MKDKFIMGALVLIGMFALFLISTGITGLVVLDPGTREVCSAESPCESPYVCCTFYGEEAGICHFPDVCSKIQELTKEQKEKNEELQRLLYQKENIPAEETNAVNALAGETKPVREAKNELVEMGLYYQVFFGSVILILVIISTIMFLQHLKEHKGKKKKKPAASQ